MTISDFFSILTTVIATGMAFFIVVSFRVLNKLKSAQFKHFELRLNEMDLRYHRLIEDLQNDIASLRRKNEALPCWKKVKPDEAATENKVVDDDAPRRSVHVVSISNGGSLGDMLGQIFGGAVPPELVAARRLFSIVESDKPTAAELKAAMSSVTDREVLDTALQGLIEGERYELAQIVKDEIASRNAQKTTK
jgi:hypothetical protein